MRTRFEFNCTVQMSSSPWRPSNSAASRNEKKNRKQIESGRLCGSVQGAVGQSQPLVLPGGRTKVSDRNKLKDRKGGGD
jgi:hypothetical protein